MWGGVQTFDTPVNGIYKLEVYGAQGGANGGYGGYSVGYIRLNKNEHLYICVGGAGVTATSTDLFGGGYNGGGAGRKDYNKNTAGSGGGATHIATTNRGVLKNYSAYRDEVLIVAGGGGGCGVSDGGSGGGSGGGLNGTHGYYGGENGKLTSPGTQTSAGNGGGFGYGGSYGYGWGNIGGGGGGWYGGGSVVANGIAPGAGGSGYIGGVPSFTYNETTYSPSTSNGLNSGNGYAKITFVSRILNVTLPAYASYTEQDHYSITAPVSGAVSFKWQVTDDSGNWEDLYDSENGLITGNIPAGFEDVTFTDSISDKNGTITISGTVTSEFDGKKLRAIVTDEDGETASSESILQVTAVERSGRTVVGQIGESAEFSFTVHGAKSAALQVRAYGSDIWETYMPAAGVVTNPITSTVRDGVVSFHFNSLLETDLKKYYRIVLTNDGSGLVSDEILLTSCIYNLYYGGTAAEKVYYDGEEVNAVYWYTGTDYILVYGFE